MTDMPFFWEDILSDAAVEDELVETGLDKGRSGIEFVKKEEAFRSRVGRKEGRRTPPCLVTIHSGNPPQVGRIEQRGPDIEEFQFPIAGDGADDG